MEYSEYMSATVQKSAKSRPPNGNSFVPVSLINSRDFNQNPSNVSESQLEHDFGRD